MSDYNPSQISSDMDQYAQEAGIQISRYTNPIQANGQQGNQKTTKLSSTPSQTSDITPRTRPARTRQRMVVDAPVVQVREKSSAFPSQIEQIQQNASTDVSPPSSPKPSSGIKTQKTPTKSALKTSQPGVKSPTGTKHVAFSHNEDITIIPNRLDGLVEFMEHSNAASSVQITNPSPQSIDFLHSIDDIQSTDADQLASELTQVLESLDPSSSGQDSSTDSYSIEERREKATEFFDFIETKLSPQLLQTQTLRDDTARTLHELEQLIQSIRLLDAAYLANNSKKQTVETKVDIGCKIFAEAKFVNENKIIVELGLGVYSEMSYADAITLTSQRCDLFQKRLTSLEDQCCMWSARIKSLHEAIGVLLDIGE